MKISLVKVRRNFIDQLERNSVFWMDKYSNPEGHRFLFFGNMWVGYVKVKGYKDCEKRELDKDKWRKMHEDFVRKCSA